MTPSRKKPGVAFWPTVVVVVALVAYPLSFGPACWIASRTGTDRSPFYTTIYAPLGRMMYRQVPVAADVLAILSSIGLPNAGAVAIPGSPDEFGERMLYRE